MRLINILAANGRVVDKNASRTSALSRVVSFKNIDGLQKLLGQAVVKVGEVDFIYQNLVDADGWVVGKRIGATRNNSGYNSSVL